MKKRTYLPHSWIDSRLTVGKSKIQGKGIIAKAPIAIGEKLMEWGGRLIKRSEIDENIHRLQTLVPIDDDLFLGLPVSDKTETIDEYLNHSCDPSAWLIDEVTVIARKNLKVGDEITIDSSTWDADEEWEFLERGNCTCQTKLCRINLTPFDWKIPALQKRFKGHFSPYIQRKIENMNNKQ